MFCYLVQLLTVYHVNLFNHYVFKLSSIYNAKSKCILTIPPLQTLKWPLKNCQELLNHVRYGYNTLLSFVSIPVMKTENYYCRFPVSMLASLLQARLWKPHSYSSYGKRNVAWLSHWQESFIWIIINHRRRNHFNLGRLNSIMGVALAPVLLCKVANIGCYNPLSPHCSNAYALEHSVHLC